MDGLAPIHVLRLEQWRPALEGDAAAAVGMAIAFAFSSRQTTQVRNLVMSTLWIHACAGNRAALMTLQMLLRERGRLRS